MILEIVKTSWKFLEKSLTYNKWECLLVKLLDVEENFFYVFLKDHIFLVLLCLFFVDFFHIWLYILYDSKNHVEIFYIKKEVENNINVMSDLKDYNASYDIILDQLILILFWIKIN